MLNATSVKKKREYGLNITIQVVVLFFAAMGTS